MLKDVCNSLLTVQASPRIFISQLGKSSAGKFFTVFHKDGRRLTAEREVSGSVFRVLKYIVTQVKCISFWSGKVFIQKLRIFFILFSLA